jgi:hypothetical protein
MASPPPPQDPEDTNKKIDTNSPAPEVPNQPPTSQKTFADPTPKGKENQKPTQKPSKKPTSTSKSSSSAEETWTCQQTLTKLRKLVDSSGRPLVAGGAPVHITLPNRCLEVNPKSVKICRFCKNKRVK